MPRGGDAGPPDARDTPIEGDRPNDTAPQLPVAGWTPRAEPRRFVKTEAKTGRVRRPDLVDGRYELQALISQGGMGRVFRARHRDLGRTCALKLVLDNYREKPEMRELFFREARLASSLSHPNITAVTDFGIDDDLGYFLVMEYLEGETLRQHLQRERPSPQLACDVLDQVTGALRYIHQRGIVHCDLKPENIFLVPGEADTLPAVKLLDFGLSWRSESDLENRLSGTPPYVAPERLQGRPPTPVSDVYSLGMILYELVAGRLPYTGTTAVQIMHQQLQNPRPPPPSRGVSPLPLQADALAARALSPDPAARHPSAEAFQGELRELMTRHGFQRRGERVSAERAPGAAVDQTVAALLQSPLPLAIIELNGALRFVNRSFLELCHPGQGASVSSFERLELARRQPELWAALGEAVGTGRPARRLVLVGAEGKAQPMLLLLAPQILRGKVAAIHATLLATVLD